MVRSIWIVCVALLVQALPVWGQDNAVSRIGKEWLQPANFVDLAWDEIDTVCPPPIALCEGVLGSVDVTGYRWASLSDLFGLLESYDVPVTPGSFFHEEIDSEWAPDVLRDFIPTTSDPESEAVVVRIPAHGSVAELSDVFSPEGADYYEFYEATSAASNTVGALFWRALSPRASARDLSVTLTENGRYDVTGHAYDTHDQSACALAMASGKCVFSCGPGSLRCEGGTAELPRGMFALFDLPLEKDGTLILQVFLLGHISLTEQLDPADFDLRPIPPPGNSPAHYRGERDNDTGAQTAFSTCVNVSADATRLESSQSACTGDRSLAFEMAVNVADPFNDPGCDSSITFNVDQDIPIVHQGFSVVSDDGARITGHFVPPGGILLGTAYDADGCGGEWHALRRF